MIYALFTTIILAAALGLWLVVDGTIRLATSENETETIGEDL